MKKIALSIILMLTAFITLTACSGPVSPVKNMQIMESEFTKETMDVLQLFGDEIKFFDYKTNDTVKSLTLDIWVYENGEWRNEGKMLDDVQPGNNRIAVGQSKYAYDLYWMKDGGYGKASYPAVIDFENLSTIGGSIPNNAAIELNKEIVLFSCMGSNQGEAFYINDENFRDVQGNAEAGVIITATFSDKTADELANL